MADDIRADDWSAPVYHSLSDPFLMGGVPPIFCLLNALGTILLTLLALLIGFYQTALTIAILGIGLHACAAIGTQYEPHWWGMWREYFRYRDSYEA